MAVCCIMLFFSLETGRYWYKFSLLSTYLWCSLERTSSLVSTQVQHFDGLCCFGHCWGFVSRVSFSFPFLLVIFFCWPNFTAAIIGILNMLRVDLIKRQLKYGFTCLGTRITINCLLLSRTFCYFTVLCSCLNEPGNERAVLVCKSHQYGCASTERWFYWHFFKNSCALKNIRNVILPWARVLNMNDVGKMIC